MDSSAPNPHGTRGRHECQWEGLGSGRLALTDHRSLSRVYLTQRTVSAGEKRSGRRRVEPERVMVSLLLPLLPSSPDHRNKQQAFVARRPGSHCVGGRESSRPFTSTLGSFLLNGVPEAIHLSDHGGDQRVGAGSGCLRCLLANKDCDK